MINWLSGHLTLYRETIPVPENMRLLLDGEVRLDAEYTFGPRRCKLFGVRVPYVLGGFILRQWRKKNAKG